jgi:hypothetical protein
VYVARLKPDAAKLCSLYYLVETVPSVKVYALPQVSVIVTVALVWNKIKDCIVDLTLKVITSGLIVSTSPNKSQR